MVRPRHWHVDNGMKYVCEDKRCKAPHMKSKNALPEPVSSEHPTCPHCGKEYLEDKRDRIDCECGWRFYVEVVFVSKPAEYRE